MSKDSDLKAFAPIKIVSLEQAVAAPLTTRRFAQAGAEVIKIERPEGDFARYYDSVVSVSYTHLTLPTKRIV